MANLLHAALVGVEGPSTRHRAGRLGGTVGNVCLRVGAGLGGRLLSGSVSEVPMMAAAAQAQLIHTAAMGSVREEEELGYRGDERSVSRRSGRQP